MGQTDRHTTAINALYLHPTGAGHSKSSGLELFSRAHTSLRCCWWCNIVTVKQTPGKTCPLSRGIAWSYLTITITLTLTLTVTPM